MFLYKLINEKVLVHCPLWLSTVSSLGRMQEITSEVFNLNNNISHSRENVILCFRSVEVARTTHQEIHKVLGYSVDGRVYSSRGQ